MITTPRQKNLIRSAFRRFGSIRPIGKAKSLCDPRGFTRGFGEINDKRMVFWFEDLSGSTHIIVEELKQFPN